VLVLVTVVRELKLENVLALLVILAVPHALVRRLKHELVDRKLLTPNGELMEDGVLALQNVVWELKLEHVLVLLVIHVVLHVLVRRLKPDLVEWQLLTPNGEILDHLEHVLQNVVRELKLELVLALLVMLVVPHALVQQLNRDRVEWKSLTPNGEILDHLDHVLQNVVWELRRDHALALLVIHAVLHVLVRQLKHELVEWQLLTQNGQLMEHLVLVLQVVVLELKQEHVLALLVILAVHHVLDLQLIQDLAERQSLMANIQRLEHGVLVQSAVAKERKQEQELASKMIHVVRTVLGLQLKPESVVKRWLPVKRLAKKQLDAKVEEFPFHFPIHVPIHNAWTKGWNVRTGHVLGTAVVVCITCI